MSQVQAIAVVLGTTLGLGLWSMVTALPRLRRPTLVQRVAPAVLDVSPEAAEFLARRNADPLPVIGALLGPFGGWLRRVSVGVLGGSEVVRRRLRSAGIRMSVEEFRGRQLVWALGGLVVGIVLIVLLASVRPIPGPVQVMIPVVAAVTAFALRDWLLQRASRARRHRIVDEFPTVLEFLALCLSAGESIHDAIARVAATGRGEFAAELAEVTAQTGTGIPLAAALRQLDERVDIPSISRCIDAVVTALDHGSPLASVLRAQANDSREESKRLLLEVAGRKEIAMMIPLVFLILPVTVLFAVYPGIFVLKSGL